MPVSTYTKAGTKATTPSKLDKRVFGLEVNNHELLQQAYLAYLANGRENLAVVKTRGLVRGGGKKPWKQKGTGRARFGSSRNPIWRGGGIVFGPTGLENYSHKLSTQSKHLALRQALSLAADSGKVKVIEAFESKEGKVAPTIKLLQKLEVDKNVLLVIEAKNDMADRATRNIPGVKAVQARYVNVFDILNADHVVASQKALEIINDWLGKDSKPAPKEVKS